MIDLEEIEARLNAATPGRMRAGIYGPERDPVELFRENVSHGSGNVWLVGAVDHPLTVGGDSDAPAHIVTTCITGNGPTSKANATFYAHAREDIAGLIAEVRRYHALFNQLPARWA